MILVDGIDSEAGSGFSTWGLDNLSVGCSEFHPLSHPITILFGKYRGFWDMVSKYPVSVVDM